MSKLEIVWVEQQSGSQVLRGVEQFGLNVFVIPIPDKPGERYTVEWIVRYVGAGCVVEVGTDFAIDSDPVKAMAKAKSGATESALGWLRNNDKAAYNTIISAISW